MPFRVFLFAAGFFLVVLLAGGFLADRLLTLPPNLLLAFIMFVTAHAAAFSATLASGDCTLCQALSANSLSALDLLSESLCAAYAMSCRLQAASSGLIPGSPLLSRCSSLVPGPQYWYPGMCSSTGNTSIALLSAVLATLSAAPNKVPGSPAMLLIRPLPRRSLKPVVLRVRIINLH